MVPPSSYGVPPLAVSLCLVRRIIDLFSRGPQPLSLRLRRALPRNAGECASFYQFKERLNELQVNQFSAEVRTLQRTMAAEGRSRNERLPVQSCQVAG